MADRPNLTGRGVIRPLRRNHGDFESATGDKLLKSNVKSVLSTDGASEDGVMMGEYPWRLEFGSSIQRIRHANIRFSDLSEDLAVVMAAQAVSRWEPRAEVLTDVSSFEGPRASQSLPTARRTRRMRILFTTDLDSSGGSDSTSEAFIEVPA